MTTRSRKQRRSQNPRRPMLNLEKLDNRELLSALLADTGRITGQKFEDRNGNGQRDTGEPGLADWTIEVSGTDAQGNVVRRSTVTLADDPNTANVDETGTYLFAGLPPGTYGLRHRSALLNGMMLTVCSPLSSFRNVCPPTKEMNLAQRL